jgi:hypothetical protein
MTLRNKTLAGGSNISLPLENSLCRTDYVMMNVEPPQTNERKACNE